jgi:two-component system, OmpR family, sensor histidine kinase SenX3
MSFVLGLLLGLAVGVVSYLLFVSTSREIPNISIPETTSDIEAREAEKLGALLQIQDAIHSLSVGVVIVDARGVVTFRNKLAESVTGVIHSDVLVEEVVEQHLFASLNGETKRQVLDLFGPPRKVFSVSATPLHLGGAVAMIEDITERYLVDAVRTDFVANISHELKTPVGALAVLAEALSQEDDLDIIHRLSEKMVDEAIRVGRTIDDLLELSRIEFGGEAVKDEVDAEAIISESISRVSPLASTHAIKVAMIELATPLKVVGDRRQLVSAIGNLVENAVKYSEVGSAVEVTARADGDWVEFTVKDFGLGIPSRDLDRVFERFYRVDRARSRDTGGTGLGLAIVRHVANNHGGDVSVTSIEGEGSTFALKIPKFVVHNQASMKESA